MTETVIDTAWEIAQWFALRPHRFRQWRKFKAFPVGTIVCCCDNVHRTIESKEKPDLLYMTDGSVYDAFNCVEPIKDDGSCHTAYQYTHDEMAEHDDDESKGDR